MKHARILDDVAVEVLDGEPQGFLHPALAALFVPVPQTVVVGSYRVGNIWYAPPSSPPVTPPPWKAIQVAIIDMLRAFTSTELIAYIETEAAARGMTPADRQAAAEGDIALQMLLSFRIWLLMYDALRLGLIEINHPETAQVLQLLAYMDVLEPHRPAEVIAALTPA